MDNDLLYLSFKCFREIIESTMKNTKHGHFKVLLKDNIYRNMIIEVLIPKKSNYATIKLFFEYRLQVKQDKLLNNHSQQVKKYLQICNYKVLKKDLLRELKDLENANYILRYTYKKNIVGETDLKLKCDIITVEEFMKLTYLNWSKYISEVNNLFTTYENIRFFKNQKDMTDFISKMTKEEVISNQTYKKNFLKSNYDMKKYCKNMIDFKELKHKETNKPLYIYEKIIRN